MGCGNTKQINPDQLSNSSPLAGDRKRKSVGVQTSQTHILDVLPQDSETQGRTKLKRNDSAAIVNPKQSSNPPLRRSTMMHDSSRALKKKSSFFHQHETDQQQQQQIQQIHLQSLLVKQSSSHSQEYDSPLEVRRKFSSESKIDLGSSAQGVNQFASSIQNSLNALNSPSIENQTANFFKNSGEQDILSSREYTNVLTNTINNIVEYNSSSPRIVSNGILPPESDQNSLGQHQYIERQQNRVPTLSKPLYAQFTGFSQDYILVGQNSSEQAIGNNQFAKKLSEIHEEKELNLQQKIGIAGERKSSIILDNEGKVITSDKRISHEQVDTPAGGISHGNNGAQQNTDIANPFNDSVISLKDQNISQVVPSSSMPLKMAKIPIQQTFNQFQQISTDHLNNGEDSRELADNRKQSNLLEESQSTPVLGDNKKINENSDSTVTSNNNNITNNNMAKNNNQPSNNNTNGNIFNNAASTTTAVKDNNPIETKKQGSFRIKTKQSLSMHTTNEQQQWPKKVGTNEQLNLEKKSSNVGKGNGEILNAQTSYKNGIAQNPLSVTTSGAKRQVNLIDLVKNQQSQQTLTGLSRHSLKSPQLNPSKVLSIKGSNDLMLKSTHEDINSQKLPRKASRAQQPSGHQAQPLRSLQREKSGNALTVSKYLSPKTNLIEFVQQISMKGGLQPTNSLSSQNLFQGQALPSGQNVVYDQNLEIDGLSPISSNINPNFRASYDYDDEGVEYEEAEGDENGAFMNDKSHTNIASFPNLHNNSSSYSGHKDNETYSNEASQTICPSVINGWELADNSRLDFDKYEFDIQAADALRASTRQASMRVLNSQLLPSFLTQQPSQSNINSSNVLQHPSLQQSQYQHMHQSIHQSQISNNGQQRVYKQQQQNTQIGASSVHRSNSSQPMQPQSSFTNRSSKRLPNLNKGDSNSNNNMNFKKEDLPNPTFKKVLSEADSSSQQDSSPKVQNLPESRLPVQQQQGDDKIIGGQGQKQPGNQQPQGLDAANNNGDERNQKKKTNSSSRSIPQIPKGVINQANSVANSNSNTNSVSVVSNSNNTNESKASINNTIKDGKTSGRSGGEQAGSPSRSPNHLSPQYLTDKRFVRGSNRKTTMEIKDIIRKRSDSSNSQNTNESVLSQGESQKHSRENGKSIPSQFSGIESQESQRVGIHQQVHNSSRNNSSSSSSSPKKIHHIRGTSKSSTQRKHSQKKKTIPSNQKIEDPGSNNNTNASEPLGMKNNPKLGNSTRVNLIELTKQNQQQQLLTQQFQSSESSLAGSQQKIASSSDDPNNPILLIQIAEERKIDRKKLSTNAANNQNLLSSLYNISEEPNEQNTEIQSRSHFEFPSSQVAIEQGNNGNKLSMNQLNNNSINPSQRQITTNSSITGQNKLASPSKNQQEMPIVPQPVFSAQYNRAATQKSSIVTPNSNSVSQNNSKQGFGDITNKSQNLLDIFSNRNNNNNNSDNSDKYPSSGLQNIPSITNTTDNRISLRSTPAPHSIQVLSHGPSGSLFPSQISAATASDFNNGQTNNLPLQSSSTSIKTAEVPEKKTNNTSNINASAQRKSSSENAQKGEDKKSAPILPQTGEKKKETSPKKAQQLISQINASQRQKTMLTQSTVQQNPQQMEKSSNNLSVNASTPHGSSQTPSTMTQSKSPSKREKFSKLSKANTTTITKTLSYSMLQEQHSVLETTKLDKSVNADGQKQINNYIVLKSVGKGSFGKVKQVIDTNSKKYYAVKIINRDKLKKRKLDRTKSAYSLIEKEVAILKRMAHPNIVKLYEVIDDQDEAKIYLVMDLLKKGSINSKAYWKVEKGKAYKEDEKYKISEEKLKKYFRDFLLGLDYLHNFANVVHRDIKPDNLLIGDMDELKIGDFGVSQMFEGNNDEFTNDNGTKCYLAPEIFKTHEFSGRPLDIWAAGICFYELLTGDRPFQGKVLEDLKKSILEKELQFPENMSEDLKQMFRKCLDKDPKKRATVTDLSNDDWVTDKGKNPLDFEVREGDIHDINDEELKSAFTKSFLSQRVNITAKLKANLNKTRSNIEKKKSFLNEDDNTLNVNKY